MPELINTEKFLNYAEFKGYNTRDADIDVDDSELTGGQNLSINYDKSISKRKGHTLYGNYLGSTTKILDLITHEPAGGTTELLTVYDTGVYRYVTGTWTLLTGGATLTSNLRADHAHFPLTGKTYITNGTDNVQVYTSGSSIASDATFKKGTYIVHYKNRLVTNISNQLWYTDLGVDTFSSNNYLKSEGDITGLEELYDKLIVTTKKKVHVIQNFSFNGVAAGPESFLPLRTDFGCIYDRTLKKVNGLCYFLGQDSEGIAKVYATDGVSVIPVSEKIANDLSNLAPAQLTNACATAYGRYYRISLTTTGNTVNNVEYLYDTIDHYWLPPFTNGLGGFSCYTTLETSGQLDVYAGSQTDGMVYKLNQVDYDETASESYTTVGASYDAAIDGNPAKRAAQSFKLSDFTTQQDVTINSVFVKLKKNAGTTTDLQVRIETDNNGVPSGTLADSDATATISAFTTTSYTYKKASFTNVVLTGNTTYWIVVKHVTEGSGNSQYYWGGDSSSPTYGNGTLALYVDSTSGTQTFNPDANPESTSVDGYIDCSPGATPFTFAEIRSGTGSRAVITSFDDQPVDYAGIYADTTTDNWSGMQKGIILFDTSSLPDDAVISSATLKIYVNVKVDQLNQSIGITSASPASNTALSSGDYATTSFGSTRFATDKTISSISVGAYNTFTLNASGIAAIDVAGVTKFAVRVSCDIDNSAPTWVFLNQGLIGWQSADYTNKPQLTVTYTSASGSAIWTADATKDENFLLFTQGDINGYGDTKAFFLAPQGQQAHLRDIFITAKASGSYNLDVGVNTGTYNNFILDSVPLTTGGALYGSTFVFGSSTLGGKVRAENKMRFRGTRARTAKFRFGNKFANEPFTVYAFRVRYQPINKFK